MVSHNQKVESVSFDKENIWKKIQNNYVFKVKFKIKLELQMI